MCRPIALLAALLAAAPLHAQQGNPYAFLSTSAKEPTQGQPQKIVPTLRLRPNNELPFYAYVRNPGDQEFTKLTVVLATDEKGENVLAEGTLAKIAAGETLRVKLTAKAPKPAEEKPPIDKPVAEKAPAASPLPDSVYLLLFRVTDDDPRAIIPSNDPNAKPLMTVRLMSPKEYLAVTPTAPANSSDILVQIGDKSKSDPFRGKPCKVTLNVRPDLIPGLDASVPREGTYEAIVAPGAEGIALSATGLKFTGANRSGLITLSADGVSHAFVYKADFSGTAPRPFEDTGILKIDVPKFAITGKPVVARLEVFGDDTVGHPVLKFYRGTAQDTPEIVTADLTTPRDQKTGFRIGADGELLASAAVKDWQATLDTGGLYGPRKLTFAMDRGNRSFAPAEATIIFDDTPPVNVEFLKPPAKAEKGMKFTVTARGEDKESGLKPDGVLFYIGELPPEGRKPAKGTAAIGKLNADGSYTAEFDTPDVKGPFDVTVRFTNNVGLSAEKAVEVLAVEVPKPTTGTIAGKIIQGDDRAQPGLEVTLTDADGKKVATEKTNEQGEFKFIEVKPGTYKVSSIKPVDYNAKGVQEAKVVAGETAKVSISLKR